MSTRPVALVTGASSGIGKSLAEGLAARGNDLLLVARDAGRLSELAEQLGRRHAVAADVLAADLTAVDGLSAVADRICSDGRIDLVANNAGFGSSGSFGEAPLEIQVGQIRLNVEALVVLSHAAVSTMVPRGSGRLLNVASIAAFQPTPLQAVYGATKAFVLSFSQALHEEVRRSGVTVTALCPGFTHTEFHERGQVEADGVPGFMWSDPAVVASAALQGLDARKAVVTPGAVNKALSLATHLPRGVVRGASGLVIRRFR